MIIVAEGFNQSPERLSSTEVLEYPSGRAWRAVADLPSPRSDLKGVTLANLFYLVGGYQYTDRFETLDDILVYNASSDTYATAGHLALERREHAVTKVPWRAVAEYCTTTTDD